MAAQNGKMKPKVTVVRTGDVIELDYRKGMTVEQAIMDAGFKPEQANKICVGTSVVKKLSRRMKAGEQISLLGHVRGA